MGSTRLNRRKLQDLILYIAEKCEADPAFGSTKLAKLLYYCDFIAYVELGRAITGGQYQRLTHGPAPKALPPAREELIKQGRLLVRETGRYGYRQLRPIALQTANLRDFTGEEIALVDAVIAALWELSATQVSTLSHKDIGWQLARQGELIPYATAFIESIEAA